MANPDDPLFQLVAGEERSRGIEVEAAGRIGTQLDLLASFAIGEAEVTEDTDPALVGNELGVFPERTASLWATYRPTGLPGLSVSGGAFHTGSRPLATSDQTEVPASTILDGAVAFAPPSLPGLRLQANIRNLLDERFYEPGNGNGEVQLGLERRFVLSAFYTF